jgi:hypothetical protein
VSQREIVEVPYQLPDGSIKPHMALVLSTEKLLNAEDGMFYAVLISSKNINPEFTMEIKNEWLNKPLASFASALFYGARGKGQGARDYITHNS